MANCTCLVSFRPIWAQIVPNWGTSNFRVPLKFGIFWKFSKNLDFSRNSKTLSKSMKNQHKIYVNALQTVKFEHSEQNIWVAKKFWKLLKNGLFCLLFCTLAQIFSPNIHFHAVKWWFSKRHCKNLLKIKNWAISN